MLCYCYQDDFEFGMRVQFLFLRWCGRGTKHLKFKCLVPLAYNVCSVSGLTGNFVLTLSTKNDLLLQSTRILFFCPSRFRACGLLYLMVPTTGCLKTWRLIFPFLVFRQNVLYLVFSSASDAYRVNSFLMPKVGNPLE